ncbi:MAG: transglycosylase SLT domain-containing protein [Bacteroidota bacterium]
MIRQVISFLGCIILFGLPHHVIAQDEDVKEVVVLRDTLLQQVIQDQQLLAKGSWELLPEIRFWRKVMNLDPEYCILNNAKTREIYQIFPTAQYDTMPDVQKRAFKDSIIEKLQLPLGTRLYVTYGKKDYYKFDKILSQINSGIHEFQEMKVDPWYGQAILLIESPGAQRVSPTGAAGPYQLMPHVGRKAGLIMNDSIDQRADPALAAKAAAGHIRNICIPHARRMLQARRVKIDEESLWFRLLVMHVYHAGARNVGGAIRKIPYKYQGMDLIQRLWHTTYRGFGNASQNYSQIAVAAMLELNRIVDNECSVLCMAP